MDWTSYPVKSVLLDFTVTALNAGATITSPYSGSSSVNGQYGVTANSITSFTVPSGSVYDVTDVFIIPPQTSSGTYPDVQIVPVIDGTPLNNLAIIDGSMPGNMFPPDDLLEGTSRHIKIGYSVREALWKRSKNLPLLITGWKAKANLAVTVTSAAGWSSPLVPLRIVMVGDIYKAADVEDLRKYGYDGLVQLNVPPTQGLTAVHAMPGPLSLDTWTALPGGTGQVGVTVNRKLAYATNLVGSNPGSILPLSNLNTIGGNTGYVGSYQDLGFDTTDGKSAFLLQEFGVNLASGISAYVGWKVGSTVVPQDTQNGTPISSGRNRFRYGADGDTGKFRSLSPSRELLKLLVYKTAAAPVVSSSAGLTAGQVTAAIGGVLLQKLA